MQEYRCKKPDCSAGETEACIRAVFSLAEILNYEANVFNNRRL